MSRVFQALFYFNSASAAFILRIASRMLSSLVA